MTRCPKTARPSQFRGRARYRFAGVTFQCVLEAGHAGPCGMEPLPTPVDVNVMAAQHDRAMSAGIAANLTQDSLAFTPQTPEQIAAGDARYREHLRRRRHG